MVFEFNSRATREAGRLSRQFLRLGRSTISTVVEEPEPPDLLPAADMANNHTKQEEGA
jgi:hypothetical protein